MAEAQNDAPKTDWVPQSHIKRDFNSITNATDEETQSMHG